MEENKPRHSEFLKTLIGKSHPNQEGRVNFALNSISKRNRKESAVSKRTDKLKKNTKKFILLNEQTDSKLEESHIKDKNTQSKLSFNVDSAEKNSENKKKRQKSETGYYISSRMSGSREASAKSKHINLTSKLESSNLKNNMNEMKENKYHYLLSSFSKNKSRYKKSFRPSERNTEILLTSEKSSYKMKNHNYTSMNYYSNHLATNEDSKNNIITPVNKNVKMNMRKNVFRSNRNLENTENKKEESKETGKINSSQTHQIQTLSNNFSNKALKKNGK